MPERMQGLDLIILQKHTGKKALSADEEFFIQSVVDRGTQAIRQQVLSGFPAECSMH